MAKLCGRHVLPRKAIERLCDVSVDNIVTRKIVKKFVSNVITLILAMHIAMVNQSLKNGSTDGKIEKDLNNSNMNFPCWVSNTVSLLGTVSYKL